MEARPFCQDAARQCQSLTTWAVARRESAGRNDRPSATSPDRGASALTLEMDTRQLRVGAEKLLMLAAVLINPGISQSADVAIDIGHTLIMPGTVSASGVSEFEFNRKLASSIARTLTASGISVQIINREGRTKSLGERTSLAAKDRIFVSIHHDSVKQRYRPVVDQRFAGYSLWVSEHTADYAGSVRCARSIADEMLEAGFQPSHYHADPVIGENRPIVDWVRGIFSNSHLAVLRTARGPAVLVEAGVIANAVEESKLNDPVLHSTLARTIAAGLAKCISSDNASSVQAISTGS